MGRTYEALRRAEAKAQNSHLPSQPSEKNGPFASNARVESWLNDLGLGKDQILKQTLKEIGQSLNRIDACMASPTSSLNLQSSDSPADMSEAIMATLIERKELILNRLDGLVSQKKFHNIYRLLNYIADKGLKTSLEKNVKTLQIKDKILKKEYQQLRQLRSASGSGLSHHSNQVSEQSDQNGKPSQKSPPKRKSLGSVIIVALLIIVTAFIVIAPLIEFQLPHFMNLALFIIWGVFFGMTIAPLVGLGKKN